MDYSTEEEFRKVWRALKCKANCNSVGGSPSLPINSVQYNKSGAFFGDALFERNPSTLRTTIGTPNNRVTLGDVTNAANLTMWRVDDANMLIKGVTADTLSIVDTSDNTFLEVNIGSKSCSFGDRDNSNNGTVLIVDDTTQLVTITNVPAFADDAAATGGGLTTGQLYKTTTGGSTYLKIVP